MEAKKCTYEKSQYPVLEGVLKEYASNETAREQLIQMGLRDFGFLVENNTLFRLCYLGQKIKEYTTDIKAVLIANLMIVHSLYYSPYLKKNDSFEQI